MKFSSIAFIVMLNICLLVQIPARAQSRKEAEAWAASSNAAIAKLAKENRQSFVSLRQRASKKVFFNLRRGVFIWDLAYSPDGQFLAILIAENEKERIEVLDKEGNAKTKISLNFNNYTAPGSKLRWDRRGQRVYLGVISKDKSIEIWDAETGKVDASLNLDVSRFSLLSAGSNQLINVIGSYFIEVLDNANGKSKRFWIAQTSILGLAWLKDDILMVDGRKTETNYEPQGIQKVTCSTCANGRVLMKLDLRDLKVLDSLPLSDSMRSMPLIKVDSREKHALLGGGFWMDLTTQSITPLMTMEKMKQWGIPNAWLDKDIVVSESGKYVLIKAGDPTLNSTAVIIDTSTQRPAYWLVAGFMGIALSPDEKTLVLGDKDSLLYYDLIETPAP